MKPGNSLRTLRILGVDPGSQLTGYGCIDIHGKNLSVVTHGTLQVSRHATSRVTLPVHQRLLEIHRGLSEVIQTYRPHVMAIEKVFFAKNALSALKLGQARGAAILSAAIHELDVFEYSATEVKATVVGHGRADKEQVAKMIQLLLGKQDFDTADASDGLALAICHAHMVAHNRTFGSTRDARDAKKSRKSSSIAQSLGLDKR